MERFKLEKGFGLAFLAVWLVLWAAVGVQSIECSDAGGRLVESGRWWECVYDQEEGNEV